MRAHDICHLKAVHFRHLYVQQNQGVIVLEQLGQGGIATGDTVQIAVHVFQHNLQSDQILRGIIHKQNAGARQLQIVVAGFSVGAHAVIRLA